MQIKELLQDAEQLKAEIITAKRNSLSRRSASNATGFISTRAQEKRRSKSIRLKKIYINLRP